MDAFLIRLKNRLAARQHAPLPERPHATATRTTRSARATRIALTASALIVVSACTLGPDYHRPDAATPAVWQTVDPAQAEEAQTYWRQAQPSHAPLTLDWWRRYGDGTLDQLEQRALTGNNTLAAALAHYDQARATLSMVTAQEVPELDAGAGVSRSRTAEDRPRTNYATATHHTVQNDFKVGPTLSYEVDLFGRIRRDVESAGDLAEQSRDDLANARLILSADVANSYFMLRELDAELDVITRSIALQQRALDYVKSQHELGAVSGLNVMQQQALLDATGVQRTLLANQRAQYQHAIAALIGVPAPQFEIAPQKIAYGVAPIPLGLPSDLLQRRPDVASAERAMASANARIGVARAAFFPSLILTPGIGWESTRFANLFSAPELMWTLGASLKQVLFDGGKRQAAMTYANAGYRAAEANYRQTVLTAFQQVQDGVTGLATLDQAARQVQQSVDDAQRLLNLAQDRYSGGLVAYLDVITAQQALLASERQATQIHAQQWTTSVNLIKALGGGWQDDGTENAAAAASRPSVRDRS